METVQSQKKVRVLVVDDSRTSREMLASLLAEDHRFEVVGKMQSGEEALAHVDELKPDLVTMDIHMPGMGGVAAVRAIMQRRPCPIVVVSDSISSKESLSAVRALDAGALEAVSRPNFKDAQSVRKILNTFHLMAQVKLAGRATRSVQPPLPQPIEVPRLIAIGASTGGPSALREILLPLPASFPIPIVISQHMAEGFIQTLVDWLNLELNLPVTVLQHGQSVLRPGIWVCPDGAQTVLEKEGTIALRASENQALNSESIDNLFESVADTLEHRAVGMLLTGMGRDGASGLLKMRQAGAYTVAQDAESSVVYGMPAVACSLQAVTLQLSLHQMSAWLIELGTKGVSRPNAL